MTPFLTTPLLTMFGEEGVTLEAFKALFAMFKIPPNCDKYA